MKSDFEKLVIAMKHIEALEKEIDLLRKEVEYQFGETRKLEIELKAERDKKEKLKPEEKLKIKSDLYVQQQANAINSLRTKLKDCQGKYEKAHSELVQAKMKLLNGK